MIIAGSLRSRVSMDKDFKSSKYFSLEGIHKSTIERRAIRSKLEKQLKKHKDIQEKTKENNEKSFVDKVEKQIKKEMKPKPNIEKTTYPNIYGLPSFNSTQMRRSIHKSPQKLKPNP